MNVTKFHEGKYQVIDSLKLKGLASEGEKKKKSEKFIWIEKIIKIRIQKLRAVNMLDDRFAKLKIEFNKMVKYLKIGNSD